MLELSGIDISIFQAHSFRGASCSTAFLSGVTLKDILSTANWSSASTFHRFYNRNIKSRSQFFCKQFYTVRIPELFCVISNDLDEKKNCYEFYIICNFAWKIEQWSKQLYIVCKKYDCVFAVFLFFIKIFTFDLIS